MISVTKLLGAQFQSFIVDVSQHLELSPGILGMAFLRAAATHVYFADFVGEVGADTIHGGSGDDADPLSIAAGSDYLDGGADNDTTDGGIGTDTLSCGGGRDQVADTKSDDGEALEGHHYELDRLSFFSVRFKHSGDERKQGLGREEMLDESMEPQIREPLIVLFGGEANVPDEVTLYLRPLKDKESYLYYIPRDGEPNEGWDLLCRVDFFVAQLLRFTLIRAMVEKLASTEEIQSLTACLPQHFGGYETQVLGDLKRADRLASALLDTTAYVDLGFRSLPREGEASKDPVALTVSFSRPGSVPRKIIRLERPRNTEQGVFDHELIDAPKGQRKNLRTLMFLILRRALLGGEGTVTEITPWLLVQNLWEPDKSMFSQHEDGLTRVERDMRKVVWVRAMDATRNRVRRANELLNVRLELSKSAPLELVEWKHGGEIHNHIPTELSKDLQSLLDLLKKEEKKYGTEDPQHIGKREPAIDADAWLWQLFIELSADVGGLGQ